MLFNAIALFLTLVLALASVASTAPAPTAPAPADPAPTDPAPAAPSPDAATNKRTYIRQNSLFCLLMPPKVGESIAANEFHAISWCTKRAVQVPNAKILPAGFITSSHYYTYPTGRYTQVTGRIDRTKFKLSPRDHGGQMDPNDPRGSFCVGYKYFVEIVQPDVQLYCLRCCINKADCPLNKASKGCKVVVPGNYS